MLGRIDSRANSNARQRLRVDCARKLIPPYGMRLRRLAAMQFKA